MNAVADGRVRVPAGTVLTLPDGTWQHGSGPLCLYVRRVLDELAGHFPGKVWLEGIRLNAQAGRPRTCIQVMVDAATLCDALSDGSEPERQAQVDKEAPMSGPHGPEYPGRAPIEPDLDDQVEEAGRDAEGGGDGVGSVDSA